MAYSFPLGRNAIYDPDFFQDCGIIYVAYGDRAYSALERSILAVRGKKDWRIAVVSDTAENGVLNLFHPDTHPGAREAKLSINQITPFEYSLYLDADTLPKGTLDAGFKMLRDGWDLVIVPSQQQDANNLFWHVSPEERQYTYDAVGYTPLQLQGGVFYFADNERVRAFFHEWREQWALYRDQDQAALVRALHKCPLKVWLLGQPYNNGAVIEHRFGTARRK